MKRTLFPHEQNGQPFFTFWYLESFKHIIPSLQINHSLVRQGDPDDLTRGRVTLRGKTIFMAFLFLMSFLRVQCTSGNY